MTGRTASCAPAVKDVIRRRLKTSFRPWSRLPNVINNNSREVSERPFLPYSLRSEGLYPTLRNVSDRHTHRHLHYYYIDYYCYFYYYYAHEVLLASLRKAISFPTDYTQGHPNLTHPRNCFINTDRQTHSCIIYIITILNPLFIFLTVYLHPTLT